MRRRTLLGTIGASTLTALGGCVSSLPGMGTATGTLATHVSDDPGDIEDFESCVVTVTSIDVLPADAADDDGDSDDDSDDEDETTTKETTTTETTQATNSTETTASTEESDGMDDGDDDSDDDESDDEALETIEVDDETVDLTAVKNDKSQLVSEAELETGEYAWLRVNLASDIDATLKDGSSAEVKVPSSGLKLNKSFEIRADTTTNFTADFTPVKRGKAASYIIQPVTKEVTVTYGSADEDDEDDEADGTTNGTTNGTSTESALTGPHLD